MNKLTYTIICLFGILLCLTLYTSNNQPAETLAKYLLKNHLADGSHNHLNREIDKALKIATHGTRYQEKYLINQFGQKDHLIVIAFLGPLLKEDPNLPKLGKALIGNCAAIDGKYIFCDSWFLERFLKVRRIDSTHVMFSDPKREYLSMFITWVLAHEVGHIAKKHSIDETSFHGFYDQESSDEYSHSREFEADAFVASLLERDEELEFKIMPLFSDILHAEITKSNFGDYSTISDNDGGVSTVNFGYNGLVEYANSPSHPHFILRICRLAEIVGKFDRPGNNLLLSQVETLIQNLRNKNE